MAELHPFCALRPAPEVAARVAAVPYDVVDDAEARALAGREPLSFLHVTRSEVDLPPGTNPYDAAVYVQAVRNFEELKRAAPLVVEPEPSLYCYRLRRGGHVQTGVAGCFSLDEYDRNVIAKHERTRKDKEDDRTRHIVELRAQTGVVLLTYRASARIRTLCARVAADEAPLYDFVAGDGIAHTIWRTSGADAKALVAAFADVPALYIADGHHRAASAARARDTLAAAGHRSVSAANFLAVAFPDGEMQILPYNRVVADLGGLPPEAFLAALRARGLQVGPGGPTPRRQGDVSMFLDGRWHTVTLPAETTGANPADRLDVAKLDREVLQPILHIADLRTDKRIDFIGAARGASELEGLVARGAAAVAFSMAAVTVRDLMAVSDAGMMMPPKSTWFEPKLRDGLLVHLI